MANPTSHGLAADRRVAVIGAGCAGLTAARALQSAGAQVTVFDKSRGVGGRMATRRFNDQRFDHGAQFFTARGAAFLEEVSALKAKGAVAPWRARWGYYTCGQLIADSSDEPRYVGVSGMNHIGRALSEGLTLVLSSEVSDLVRVNDRWSLEFAAGGEPKAGFDTIILAVPAPQAVPLLTGISDFAIEVAAATYAPCWALMVQFASPPQILYDAIKVEGPIISWVARNASKPGIDSSLETWVVHAAPEWSFAALEEAAEDVRDVLVDRFREVFAITETVTAAVAHRWRYALVRETAGLPAYWDPALGIGACGDWCLGPRVEAAFDSGLALAQVILGR